MDSSLKHLTGAPQLDEMPESLRTGEWRTLGQVGEQHAMPFNNAFNQCPRLLRKPCFVPFPIFRYRPVDIPCDVALVHHPVRRKSANSTVDKSASRLRFTDSKDGSFRAERALLSLLSVTGLSCVVSLGRPQTHRRSLHFRICQPSNTSTRSDRTLRSGLLAILGARTLLGAKGIATRPACFITSGFASASIVSSSLSCSKPSTAGLLIATGLSRTTSGTSSTGTSTFVLVASTCLRDFLLLLVHSLLPYPQFFFPHFQHEPLPHSFLMHLLNPNLMPHSSFSSS